MESFLLIKDQGIVDSPATVVLMICSKSILLCSNLPLHPPSPHRMGGIKGRYYTCHPGTQFDSVDYDTELYAVNFNAVFT